MEVSASRALHPPLLLLLLLPNNTDVVDVVDIGLESANADADDGVTLLAPSPSPLRALPPTLTVALTFSVEETTWATTSF